MAAINDPDVNAHGQMVCKTCREPVRVTCDPRAPGVPDDVFIECVNDGCAMSRVGRQPYFRTE